MSNYSIKLLYRHFYKNLQKNQTKSQGNIFRETIEYEIEAFRSRSDKKEELLDLKKIDSLIFNYIEMRKNIKKEEFLLSYYGINQYQDTKEKIQQVARYCGLSITDTKHSLKLEKGLQ